MDDKATLFYKKTEDLYAHWQSKLEPHSKELVSFSGLVQAIKQRGNLTYRGQLVDLYFKSPYQDEFLFYKFLYMVGFDVFDPHRQGFKEIADDLKFLEFKVKAYIKGTSRLKNWQKEKLSKQLVQFHECLSSKIIEKGTFELTDEEINDSASRYVKQFNNIKGKQRKHLISILYDAVGNKAYDVIFESIKFHLGSVTQKFTQEAVDLMENILDSQDPFQAWLNTAPELLDSTLIPSIKEILLKEGIEVDTKPLQTNFDEKVIQFFFDNIGQFKRFLNLDVSYERLILPRLGTTTSLQSPGEYLQKITTLLENPFEWNLKTHNILVAGYYLKQLNLIQFFQDFEEGLDLSSYFDQLSKDITHLDYYKKVSVKDQEKLLTSYFFNALGKLTFLYADLNQAQLDNKKLVEQSKDYVKAKFAPQEAVNLLGDTAQVVVKKPSCFYSLIFDFQIRKAMIALGLLGLSVAYIAAGAALGIAVPIITALSYVVAVLSFSYCFLMVFDYLYEKNDASLVKPQP